MKQVREHVKFCISFFAIIAFGAAWSSPHAELSRIVVKEYRTGLWTSVRRISYDRSTTGAITVLTETNNSGWQPFEKKIAAHDATGFDTLIINFRWSSDHWDTTSIIRQSLAKDGQEIIIEETEFLQGVRKQDLAVKRKIAQTFDGNGKPERVVKLTYSYHSDSYDTIAKTTYDRSVAGIVAIHDSTKETGEWLVSGKKVEVYDDQRLSRDSLWLRVSAGVITPIRYSDYMYNADDELSLKETYSIGTGTAIEQRRYYYTHPSITVRPKKFVKAVGRSSFSRQRSYTLSGRRIEIVSEKSTSNDGKGAVFFYISEHNHSHLRLNKEIPQK